jgi:hypothetical protein
LKVAHWSIRIADSAQDVWIRPGKGVQSFQITIKEQVGYNLLQLAEPVLIDPTYDGYMPEHGSTNRNRS